MRFIPGKFVLAAAMTAAAAATVKVPFEFKAAGKVFPAGTYNIEKDSTLNSVTLYNKETAEGITMLVGPGAPDPNDSAISLKFDQDGESRILRTVQYGSQITSRLDRRQSEADHLMATGR